MGRIFGKFLFPAGLVLGIALNAKAYTPTLGPAGTQIRWPGSRVHFELAGNSLNQSGISPSDFYTSVVHGLQRWTTASGGSLSFDYWQGSDPGVYVQASAYDGLSTIYFASQAKAHPHLASNVLGLTQVWYDATQGRILETDIVLNDRDFYFTTNSRDTSGFGSGGMSFANGKSHVFIENVITHELGHAFGLSHSGGLQSTMLFMESPEQAHLSCDESVGIHALYPSPDQGLRGAIQGKVVNESGSPVVGAHVVAISRRRGQVLASALTDPAGSYSIAALEPGAYFLLVEPFYAGPQTLPSYYSGMKSDFCPNGRVFGRTFLTESRGVRPAPIFVQPSQNTQAPVITAQCRGEGGAAVSMQPASSRMSTAPVLYPQNAGDLGLGWSDQLNVWGANYYRLQGIQGRLEIHAMSYSLYSPVRPILSLEDTQGRKYPVTTLENVYQGDSGYVNFDSALYAEQLPLGDYYLKIHSTELDMSLYPAGTVSLDVVPFLLISGSVNEPAPSLAASLPNNARCQMEENFAPYSSPPGNPPRHPRESDQSTGFCATVSEAGRLPGGGSRNDHGGTGAVASRVGWFLPFILIGILARILRRPVRPLAPKERCATMTE